MSVYVTKDSQLVDDNFYGRKIKYTLWEENSKTKGPAFHRKVRSAHEKVKASLHSEDRKNITGRQFQPLVRHFHGMDAAQQQEVLLKGLTRFHLEEKPHEITMETLLRRYMAEDKDRRKHKTHFLNDLYANKWLLFLGKRHPNLPYDDFTKRIVEEYVEWRKDFRAMTDRRSGAVSAETINKEVSEANRCIQWARAERIVQSECNAFYKVKVRKDASNTRIIEPVAT